MVEQQLSRRDMLAMGCVSFVPAMSFRQSVTPAPTIRGVSEAESTRIAKLGNDFQKKFKLPGVSLAMSYRGKLKLLACFGHANKEQNIAVRPQHQFRIASVSKPITSVAVLKLAEQQKLSLGDSVFGPDGHLRELLQDNVIDTEKKSWTQQITLRHLLEHTGGGWSNSKGETPMFAGPALGMNHAKLIEWTLKNIPLKTRPGTKYAYSNFGYCLLGRVIEKVTGLPYQQAVKNLVLSSAGANSTVVGSRTVAERRPDEVVYYDKHDPYGRNMDVARMDAHGGWISTATDLVRFAQHVDGFNTPPDILTKASIKTMTTPTQGNYALGWKTNASNNWWHTGSFNGGSSILARISDGHCWSVLVNTRSHEPGYFAALDKFPWAVKGVVRQWATHDLFREPNPG